MKFILRSEGVNEAIEAKSMKAARKAAHEWQRKGDWDTLNGTIWVETYVIPVDEDGNEQWSEHERITTQIDPEAPRCVDGACDSHDWQSPHEVVGGLRENPGVWGKGGGLVFQEVCMRCGCGRTTDTWAQRRDNGEQGLTSVSYEARKYDVTNVT
jgi:hypothetical protein